MLCIGYVAVRSGGSKLDRRFDERTYQIKISRGQKRSAYELDCQYIELLGNVMVLVNRGHHPAYSMRSERISSIVSPSYRLASPHVHRRISLNGAKPIIITTLQLCGF